MKNRVTGVIQVQTTRPPTVELDSEAHAAYIRFRTSTVANTHLVTDKSCVITIDRDRQGKVVGIELIGVDNFNIRALLAKVPIRLSRKLQNEAKYVPSSDLLAA
jgi:uncharacterized protein YuzE